MKQIIEYLENSESISAEEYHHVRRNTSDKKPIESYIEELVWIFYQDDRDIKELKEQLETIKGLYQLKQEDINCKVNLSST
jgi:hypothetical protein